MLSTQFVALDIELPSSTAQLSDAIAHHLRPLGEPLRWAITSVDRDRRTVHIEAVVLVDLLQVVSPQSVLSV